MDLTSDHPIVASPEEDTVGIPPTASPSQPPLPRRSGRIAALKPSTMPSSSFPAKSAPFKSGVKRKRTAGTSKAKVPNNQQRQCSIVLHSLSPAENLPSTRSARNQRLFDASDSQTSENDQQAWACIEAEDHVPVVDLTRNESYIQEEDEDGIQAGGNVEAEDYDGFGDYLLDEGYIQNQDYVQHDDYIYIQDEDNIQAEDHILDEDHIQDENYIQAEDHFGAEHDFSRDRNPITATDWRQPFRAHIGSRTPVNTAPSSVIDLTSDPVIELHSDSDYDSVIDLTSDPVIELDSDSDALGL